MIVCYASSDTMTIGSRRHILKFFFFICFGFILVKLLNLVAVSHRQSVQQVVVEKESSPDGVNLVSIISGLVDEPKFVEFEPDSPKKIVVMTYQRCGSSFFGQLFNTNPGVFYMYEPLDSLYSAMYGVKEGWNVPSDITTHWNGTERVIPENERRAVAAFLQHLLSCHVKSLPTETLIHRFWFLFYYYHESLEDYRKCLESNKLKYTRCAAFTPGFCGGRFGQFGENKSQLCNRMLWNEELRNDKDDVMSQNMSLYRTCMDDMRQEVDSKCSDLFIRNCEKSELRATKTVRATMYSMGFLLSQDDNLRVIHMIRDPRAVVLSRKNFDNSARSHYAGGNMVKEAEVYCRDVVRDVKERRHLEKTHPGRIMTVIYDDFTKKPMQYAENIYKFLNSSLHIKTTKWLIKNTSKSKNSTVIANKWQQKLTYDIANQIMSKCKDFFKEVDYAFS